MFALNWNGYGLKLEGAQNSKLKTQAEWVCLLLYTRVLFLVFALLLVSLLVGAHVLFLFFIIYYYMRWDAERCKTRERERLIKLSWGMKSLCRRQGDIIWHDMTRQQDKKSNSYMIHICHSPFTICLMSNVMILIFHVQHN